MINWNRMIGGIEFGVSLLMAIIPVPIGLSVAFTGAEFPVPMYILYAMPIVSVLLFGDSLRRWDIEWDRIMGRDR